MMERPVLGCFVLAEIAGEVAEGRLVVLRGGGRAATMHRERSGLGSTTFMGIPTAGCDRQALAVLKKF